MACFKPIRARYDGTKLKFAKDDPGNIDIPCGRCIGCRLDYAQQWAVRCLHEASLYDDNCYITLTYADENIPEAGSLDHRDFQKFMKKLRKRISPGRVRYYMCGEYGEQLERPHYHALLFGYDFPDKYLWKEIKGNPCYRSDLLEQDWDLGYSTIGGVTFESAAYVARYILKKQKGKGTLAHYSHIDEETGEILSTRVPEYTRMSLRAEKGEPGGIGSSWYKAFGGDVFPSDEVVINGRKFRAPRYYDELLRRDEPGTYESVKRARRERAANNSHNSRERLETREKCAEARVKNQKRGYEDGTEDLCDIRSES